MTSVISKAKKLIKNITSSSGKQSKKNQITDVESLTTNANDINETKSTPAVDGCPVDKGSGLNTPISSRPKQKEPKLFRYGCGYATQTGRDDYLKDKGITKEKAQHISDKFVADTNVTTTLYYWQLNSLLGPQRIRALITSFYKQVYMDEENPWFRDIFKRISGIEHHIATQTAFWVDAMGGGAAYHGGDFRLEYHHESNAHSIMNATYEYCIRRSYTNIHGY